MMADRKKVIEGLEDTAKYFRYLQTVGYFGDQPVYREHEENCNDAIALLKEQEVKTGTWQWKIHGKAESGGTLGEAICDQCGKSTCPLVEIKDEENLIDKISGFLATNYEPPIVPGEKIPLTISERAEAWSVFLTGYIGGA